LGTRSLTMPYATAQRTLTLAILAILVFIWWYAAMLEWRGEALANDILNRRVSTGNVDTVPLSPAPARTTAQRLLISDDPDYPRIEDLLAYSLNLRPIYAPYWLDRAEAAYNAGAMQDATRYLNTATGLWPTRPILLWKAAMLHARLGGVDHSLAAMHAFLQANPNAYRQVVAVASRMEPNPARMLDAILPGSLPDPERINRDDLVWRILRDASYTTNTALTTAAWQALSPKAKNNPEIVGHYVERMIAADEPKEAIAVWSAHRSLDPLPALENGSFEDAPRGALGWRINDHSGARIERDRQIAYAGQSSLKVTFPGNDNLNFHHLRQYLPVQPGKRYTLSWHWRGEAVSTRSGPYIEVVAPGKGHVANTKDRWGTWDWQRQAITFTAPETVSVIEMRVRRRPTNALDNKIAGTLWLDAFELTTEAGEVASH